MPLLHDPRYHTFVSWASLLVEQYAHFQLTIPSEDTDWREWAEAVQANNTFANSGVPGPRYFDEWSDWAEQAMNVLTSIQE